MFSVVIPLYNKELSITKTIGSVLRQSFTEFEVIVIDDGSTDRSLEVVKKISDSRLRIIEKRNGGVSTARNRGIEEARHEWIAFLDGDDLWEHNHLEVVYDMIMKYPTDKVFCTSFVRSTQPFPTRMDHSIEIVNDYFERAIEEHFFWTSVAVLKKDVLETVGGFRTDISRGEDLDLWGRIGEKFRFVCSKTITAIYVQDSENKITNSAFDYRKSVFVDIHYRIRLFTRKTQKAYYLRILWNGAKSFLLRGDWRNTLRTLYRLLILKSVKIYNERNP